MPEAQGAHRESIGMLCARASNGRSRNASTIRFTCPIGTTPLALPVSSFFFGNAVTCHHSDFFATSDYPRRWPVAFKVSSNGDAEPCEYRDHLDLWMVLVRQGVPGLGLPPSDSSAGTLRDRSW